LLSADPRDASPSVEPSLSLERRKTMGAVEDLSVPLSRLLSLNAELEWNREDSNDLSQNHPPRS
jgi:hypothetical protein